MPDRGQGQMRCSRSFRAALPRDGESAPKLLGERAHQLHAERITLAHVEPRGYAYAGIGHAQGHVPVWRHAEVKGDASRLPVREGVFQSIREEFVEDQAAGNGAVEREHEFLEPGSECHAALPAAVGAQQGVPEPFDVWDQVKGGHVPDLIEGLVDERHGMDALFAFVKEPPQRRVLEQHPWRLKRLQTTWRLFFTRWWTSLRRTSFSWRATVRRASLARNAISICWRSLMSTRTFTAPSSVPDAS